MNGTANTTDIPVSSLTYAIKGQRLLERYGYIAWAGRNHNRTRGCGYKLTVKGDAEQAKQILIRGGIKLAREAYSPEGGAGR